MLTRRALEGDDGSAGPPIALNAGVEDVRVLVERHHQRLLLAWAGSAPSIRAMAGPAEPSSPSARAV